MMHLNIKNIISFAVGAASGALVTYKLLKDKYEKDMHEETEWLKAYYEKYYTSENKNVVRDSKDIPVVSDEEYNGMTEEEYYEQEEKKENIKTYVKLSRSYDTNYSDPAEEEYPEEDIMQEHCEEIYNSGSGIYVISAEEFNMEMLHFDKITISYYDGDDTLADEQEEIITDIESVVGDDALTKFGYMSGDQDIVFVRNENLSVDYEVVRVFNSYSETVLGITDRPVVKRWK